MASYILIVEGPAGSGKSTIINTLKNDLGCAAIQRSLPVRNPGAVDAALTSWRLDLIKVQDAIVAPEQVALVDRCMLSQWVYGNIRAGHRRPKPSASSVWMDYRDVLHHTQVDLENRLQMAGLEAPAPPQFGFLILLPPLPRLISQRERAGRDFSFDPEKELEFYGEAARVLKPSGNLTFVKEWAHEHSGPLATEVLKWQKRHIDRS